MAHHDEVALALVEYFLENESQRPSLLRARDYWLRRCELDRQMDSLADRIAKKVVSLLAPWK